MVAICSTAVVASLLVFGAPTALASSAAVDSSPPSAQVQAMEVGAIDFYGLRQVTEKEVREALGIDEGDLLERQEWNSSRKQLVLSRLERLPGVVAARVTVNCCIDGKLTLYVGIQEETGGRERAAAAVALHPPPQSDVALPAEIVDAYERFMEALEKAVVAGDSAEDWSDGHSLARNSGVRAEQEKFLVYADQHLTILRDVLRNAADPEQREIAATVLGYASDKRDVVGDLVHAARDPDEDVRNNAVRALGVIATLAQSRPDLGIDIPAASFIDMLNSIEFSDRNKGSFVLSVLSESRDPEMLRQLRERALESLVEMARWKGPGHAMPARAMLGRMAGLSDEEIREAFETGVRDEVIAKMVRLIRALEGPMSAQTPDIQRLTLALEGGADLRYAISVPPGYDTDQPVPLILALHFGWGEALPPNYGAIFIEILVEPALRELGAIVVAPNCPGRSWVERRSEEAVLQLLEKVRSEYNVDPDRIVVTGFSLGGMGTWYFAARHADMLSAAIPMASVPIVTGGNASGRDAVQRFREEGSVDWPPSLLELPMYVLHSRQDELIPIGPVEAAVAELRAAGGEVEFLAIEGVRHHETPRYVPYLKRTVPWIKQVWARR